MKKYIALIVAVAVTFALIRCSDDDDNGGIWDDPGYSYLEVRLVDSPYIYDQVNLDIVAVGLYTVNGNSGWNDHNVRYPGHINLLNLRNGVDSLLISERLSSDHSLRQVRLLLGDDNYVVVDGQRHSLSTSSDSGLTVRFPKDLLRGQTHTVWLDVDIAASVIRSGDTYIFEPVLRVYDENSGAVSGVVLPPDAMIEIRVERKDQTITGYPNSQGRFHIAGLEAANDWKISYIPYNEEYEGVTLENIKVVERQATIIDTTVLPEK